MQRHGRLDQIIDKAHTMPVPHFGIHRCRLDKNSNSFDATGVARLI